MNPYYSNGSQTKPRLNVVQAKRVDAADIAPPLPTVTRTANGGSSPGFYTVVDAAVIDNGFKFGGGYFLTNNNPVAGRASFVALFAGGIPWITNKVAGQSINNIICGRLLNNSPTVAGTIANGAQISSTITYNKIGGGTGTLLNAHIIVVVPATGGAPYDCDLKVSMATNLPADFLSPLKMDLVIATTPAGAISYSYTVNTPVGYPSPANVTIEYNTSAIATTTEIISVLATGQLLKTFPAASDPVAAFGGSFDIIASQNPSGGGASPAPFGGWLLNFTSPFVLVGTADPLDLQTGGGVSYPDALSPQIMVLSEQHNGTPTFWPTLKYGLALANAAGIKNGSDISKSGITLLDSVTSRQFEKVLLPLFGTDMVPASTFPMLKGEAMVKDLIEDLLVIDAAGDHIHSEAWNQLYNDIFALTDNDLWGAPGLYFVPDEDESLPATNSPYWAGWDNFDGNDELNFSTLELKGIS